MEFLYKIYYFFSYLKFKLFIKHLNPKVCLHWEGRVINGAYVTIENATLGRGWLLAVYPEYAGVKNPCEKMVF